MTQRNYQLVKFDGRQPTAWYRQAARLHQAEIREGFLSSLGERFLTGLYRGIVQSPAGFVVAACHEGQVIGFIAGAESTRQVYRSYLRRRAWIDGWTLLPKLVSTAHVRRVWETLRYPAQQSPTTLPEAEILNFCVCRDWQGAGVGRRLFAALAAEFAERGVEEIRIVTGVDQLRARRFYEQIGARQATTAAIHEGSVSLVFTYSISDAARGRAA